MKVLDEMKFPAKARLMSSRKVACQRSIGPNWLGYMGGVETEGWIVVSSCRLWLKVSELPSTFSRLHGSVVPRANFAGRRFPSERHRRMQSFSRIHQDCLRLHNGKHSFAKMNSFEQFIIHPDNIDHPGKFKLIFHFEVSWKSCLCQVRPQESMRLWWKKRDFFKFFAHLQIA